MNWEKLKRKYVCSLCGEEIKKGEMALMYRKKAWRFSATIAIHKAHIKLIKCIKCPKKLKCMTENDNDNFNYEKDMCVLGEIKAKG